MTDRIPYSEIEKTKPVSELTDAEKQTVKEELNLGPVQFWLDEDSICNSRFFTEILTRLTSNRDANIIITASSETGVGKTTLAVTLAILIDMWGWTAEKCAVADPAAYNRLYDESRPGSVLILDEAEKAVDARRGMTSESVDLSQSFAAKRYRQIISILTAPTKSWVDGRIGSDAADYWLLCQETDMGEPKGEAVVYRLGSNEFYENETKHRYETIEFPILDDHPEFQRLDEMKRKKLEGRDEGGTQYLSQSEVDEKIQSVKAETESEYRNQLIRDLYETGKLTQTEIADAVGLTQSTVNKILTNR